MRVLKNEFTEDEKCHNLMRWLKVFPFFSTSAGAECRIHGDPHHVMWDGTHYTYGGHRCWFDVLYHDDDFFIKGYYEQCSGQRSCVKEIAIRYKSWDISLQKKNKVKVNNNPVNSFPHVTSDGLITTASDASETRYTYTIELPNAAVIRWDGKKDVQIEVGMSFINSIHGKLTEGVITSVKS